MIVYFTGIDSSARDSVSDRSKKLGLLVAKGNPRMRVSARQHSRESRRTWGNAEALLAGLAVP